MNNNSGWVGSAAGGRLFLCILLTQVACNGSKPLEALKQVEVPNFEQVEDGMERQLNAEFTNLSRLMNDREVESTVLGDAYGKVGQLLLYGHFDGPAQAALQNAQFLSPKDVRWPYYLGYLSFRLGQMSDAATAFARACRLKPQEAIIWLRLGK